MWLPNYPDPNLTKHSWDMPEKWWPAKTQFCSQFTFYLSRAHVLSHNLCVMHLSSTWVSVAAHWSILRYNYITLWYANISVHSAKWTFQVWTPQLHFADIAAVFHWGRVLFAPLRVVCVCETDRLIGCRVQAPISQLYSPLTVCPPVPVQVRVSLWCETPIRWTYDIWDYGWALNPNVYLRTG